MAAPSDTEAVRYRTLVTDQSLVSVFAVAGVAAVGANAVPVALPAVEAAFRLTESEIGLVMSAFFLAVLVMHPFVGMLADFLGRRSVVIGSLILFGLSGVAVLEVDSFRALLVLRAVQGLAFAGTLPFTATLTGDLYIGAEGSAAQGIRSGLTGLASAITPIIAGVLAVLAWQYPFALFALAFPVAVLVYRYFPEPVDRRARDVTGEPLLAELREYWLAIWESADRRLAILYFGGFVLFFLKGGFMTFLPVYVVSGFGSTVTVAGTILGIYGAVRVVISPLSGSIVARFGRKSTLAIGVGLAVLGMGSIPFAPTLLVLGAAAAGYAAGEALLNPVLTDAVAAASVDEQRAGIMSGLNMHKDGGLVISPVLLGAIIGVSGFTNAFLVAAVLGACYGLILTFHFST